MDRPHESPEGAFWTGRGKARRSAFLAIGSAVLWACLGAAPAAPPPTGPIRVPTPPSPRTQPAPDGDEATPAPRPFRVFEPEAFPDEDETGQRHGKVGTTPRPTPEVLKKFAEFIDRRIDPSNTLEVVLGRPTVLVFKRAPKRVQIPDDTVATGTTVTDRELSILGKQIGSTVLNLWFADPADPTKETVLSYLILVRPDPEARQRIETQLKLLANEVNKAFCNSHICLTLVGDKVLLTGQAHDVAEANKIFLIVRAQMQRGGQGRQTGGNQVNVSVANVPGISDLLQSPTPEDLERYVVAGAPNVVNLLRVPGEQQVLLRVTVAEVNRAAARSIGLNFSIINNQGIPVFSQLTGNVSGAGGSSGGSTGNAFSSSGSGGSNGSQGQLSANLPIFLDNGQIAVRFNALRTLNFARSLAEPTLITMNGQTANFQAGGSFPVPAGSSTFGAAVQGVAFVPFGVQLSFSPIITDKDRIRLTVNANVSTRDPGTTQVSGSTVPTGLNTRNFQTTVEMREGQTFAVAGLIQNNFGADSSRVPFLGDVPLLGRFWSADRTSAGEQELIMLVTPELVHPLDADHVPPLPGSDLIEPGDLEFYLFGKLEGRRTFDYRSPAMTDINRMIRYRHCDQLFMIGPTGHSDGH